MYLNFALTIVLAIAIDGSHSVIADKENFDVVKPSPTAQLPDQRRRVNFKDNTVEERQKNNQPSETESEKAKDSKQDKQTRTIPGPLGADNTDKCIRKLQNACLFKKWKKLYWFENIKKSRKINRIFLYRKKKLLLILQTN